MVTDCRLYLEDLAENGLKKPGNPVIVQKFDCEFYRTGETAGVPDGPNATNVEFVIRLGETSNARVFFEHLRSNEIYPYTFLFTEKSANDKILEYRNGIVLRAKLVALDEQYTLGYDSGEWNTLTLLHVTMEVAETVILEKNGSHRAISSFN